MTNKYVCDRCGSENIIKKGFVNGKQRFMCKKCGKTFFGTRKNLKKTKHKLNEAKSGREATSDILGMHNQYFNQ